MNGIWKEITADWKGGSTFIANNPSGGSVQMGTIDGKPGVGPMELVLAGLGGCTGMDVASILLKKREDLTDLKIQVRGVMAEEYPKVYKEIHVTYLLWGNNLNKESVEQAIQLSEEKYCSVGLMLRAVVPVITNYKILEPGELMVKEDQEMIHG